MSRTLVSIVLVACAVAAFALGTTPPRAALATQPAGCWPARPHDSGSSSASILTADGERTYLLHVPPSYNGVDTVPLVFAFHGITGSAANMESTSQLSALADTPEGGFIVVYPQGLVTTWGTPHFNNWQFPSPEPDDVAFVTQLLDALDLQLCIDASRVYSTGFSNGAMMSVRLACSLSSRIAAVGLVSGAFYPPDWVGGYDTCPDTTSIPVIALHGTADTTVPFDGGSDIPGTFLVYRLPIDNDTPDEDVMADWAAHDNCASGRQASDITGDVHLVQYGSCDGGALVQLYILDGEVHAWPGSPDAPPPDDGSNGISAADLVWQFFRGYSLDHSPLADTDGDGVPDMHDHDDDNDGCTDAHELGSDPMRGGMRDPRNSWDYPDMPPRDQKIGINDVSYVIQRYRHDVGGTTLPLYDALADHSLLGPNPWNLGPGDGRIRVDDVSNVISQYRHNCA